MTRAALPLLASALVAAGPAAAKTVVIPYVEVQQLVTGTLSGDGDTVTYTSLVAGVDAQVATRNFAGQLDYRYDRYFGWGHDATDASVHTGLARAAYVAVPDLLTLDGAAIATRARTSLRDPSPVFFAGDTSNTSQLYALEAGPSLAHRFGDLDATASYHFGYVHIDNGAGDLDLGPGAPLLEDHTSSTSHNVTASLGMATGVLPFGWMVSGGWVRENQHRLDARFTDRFVRADVTLPLSWSLAAVGGIGYEKIGESQQQLLVDGTGNAILSNDRRLQGDPSKPRLLSYDQDGLIWDAGILWKPDRRTSLEARYGHRYGGEIWYGSFSHQLSPTATIQAGVYNQLDTFGLGLTGTIATLPTSFANPTGPFGGSLDGCVAGAAGGACLGGALQSVDGSLFRARGAWALYSGGRGRWSYGIGAAYAERRYIAANSGGAIGTLDGVVDKSATAQANLSRQLSRVSSLSGDIYATWYNSGLPGTPSVTSYGASGFYQRSFSAHLEGQAGAGIYTSETANADDPIVGSLLVGLRYQF